METSVVRSRGRPRKRRREENRSADVSDKSNVDDSRKGGRLVRKREGEVRRLVLVGRYVMKEFDGSGGFIGKVVGYDTGLYRVEYEDGDFEDFDSGELCGVLIGNEGEFFVGDLMKRKIKLDEYLAKKVGPALKDVEKDVVMKVEVDEIKGTEVDDDDDDDEYGRGWEARSEIEIPDVPPPELPPSSMNIAVAEEYVPHLLSVYGFLRSFGTRLFLCPFSLDDLVGCLNCNVPCTLLDSIHVALLRTLRRYLESLASDGSGSERISKCLRCIDWGLLDMLTWPVYLVHYLITMDHLRGDKWNRFYTDVLEKDYCTLSVGMKLTVLQILCDDALDNAYIREEIDTREESEVRVDSDALPSLGFVPKKTCPRHCKKLAGNDLRENVDTVNGKEDRNVDECRLCGMEGMLLCCDGCPSAYHSRCIGVSKLSIPEQEWFCPECTFNRIGPTINLGTSLRGAEVFGVDIYSQLFLGTCNHLLVLKVSVKTTPFVRYYNHQDIVKVVNTLCATPFHASVYMSICEAILKHWGLPRSLVPSLINNHSILALENRISENGNHEVLHSLGGAPSSRNVSALEKGNTDSFGIQTDKNKTSTYSYTGSTFKPYAYINNYVHGEYAASSAANFASLLSDENGISDIHTSDPRKAMSANISIQTKAFAMAATCFFWPSTEKKLIDVPRERCTWCLHCKSSVFSKKGCLLNQAALNATRAEMKFFLNCRLSKNVEGGLYGIVIYVLYLEDNLRGLMVGPFKSRVYREEWCKKVKEASACRDLKSCLLELEGNLSTIAISSEWTKVVDDWMDESSTSQSACPIESTQKCGPGRRRKHLGPVKTTPEGSNGDSRNTTWWRGGKLAKRVLRKATLPPSVLKKSARQGGSTRMPGVYYADNPEVPKRSRQFIWRAAVEMARNVSQLALQVRYLDHYIKWSDLVHPDQSIQDAKMSDSESSAFRNALICDKKVVDNKINYGLVFGNSKYLSTRLMKSIIDKETTEDGKDKYWFSETRLPLYLIKEYEEKAEKTLLLCPNEPPKEWLRGSRALSRLQEKQVRDFRRNVFWYLASKKDNLSLCLCTSCQKDVQIDFAATCGSCKGYCHKECTLSSTVLTEGDVEFTTFCKRCTRTKVILTQNNITESPASPLTQPGSGYQIARPKYISQQHKNSEIPSYYKNLSPSTIRKRSCHWGLIWKKRPLDDGSKFRAKNILFEGGLRDGNGLKPVCYFCRRPYDPDFMYISCETCLQWYHADAVELDRSKLSNLLGFKCTRCRRIKSPICPYANPDAKKTTLKNSHIRGSQDEGMAISSASEAMSERSESPLPSTSISSMEDEPIHEPKIEVRKLQVPRQANTEKNNGSNSHGKDDVALPSNNKWDASDDGVVVDENIEYEPRPPFSCMGFFDQREVEPVMKPVNQSRCDMCSKIEPLPDRCCQNCGLMIHTHCSPWEEEYSQGENWNCGRCRAWR